MCLFLYVWICNLKWLKLEYVWSFTKYVQFVLLSKMHFVNNFQHLFLFYSTLTNKAGLCKTSIIFIFIGTMCIYNLKVTCFLKCFSNCHVWNFSFCSHNWLWFSTFHSKAGLCKSNIYYYYYYHHDFYYLFYVFAFIIKHGTCDFKSDTFMQIFYITILNEVLHSKYIVPFYNLVIE